MSRVADLSAEIMRTGMSVSDDCLSMSDGKGADGYLVAYVGDMWALWVPGDANARYRSADVLACMARVPSRPDHVCWADDSLCAQCGAGGASC